MPISYTFHTADVFTDNMHGGNPLAVVPDPRGLSDAQMLAVTREFNYSETVFVLPPTNKSNTRKLRIFTALRPIGGWGLNASAGFHKLKL